MTLVKEGAAMIPLDVMFVFIGVAAALAAVPGPDNIFVLTQSALHGRLAGLIVTLGLASGLIFHTTAVAFGVAVLFQTSQYAFVVLKYAGAAYLLYLAWKAFIATTNKFEGAKTNSETVPKQFLRGLFMNIANPKITIFFLAFLPQFVDLANGSMTAQFYQLGALMAVTMVIIFGSIALAAGALGDWIKGSPKTQILLNGISGVVFVALALKLASAEK